MGIRSALFYSYGPREKQTKRLAEKLLQIREALGLSQPELAAQLGNYRTHRDISKYERGKSVPPIEVVLAYSRVANVQIEQIVEMMLICRSKYFERTVQQLDAE